MLLWKTYDLADTERALMFRRNRFERILGPGRHRIRDLKGEVDIKVYDISMLVFGNVHAKFLMKNYKSELSHDLQSFELTDMEVGLFYRDGHLSEVLAPGTQRIVWKGVEDVRLDTISIEDEFEIPNKLLALLGRGLGAARCKNASQAMAYIEVPDGQVGMLLVNGKFERLLASGSYGFWKYNRSISLKLMDLRLQSVEVSGQEILTKDRVSLRLNLSANYKVIDVDKAVLKMNDYVGFIYRELQLKLREAVGTQTLDALLEDKDSLNMGISQGVKLKMAEYGIEVSGVGVKDIILPGDMKLILNQVVEAQKESEANLIRRREETQAMRSLHNTAKVMESNPMLLRLKELEALERVTGSIGNMTVYGGLDGVMNDLIKLSPKMREV